MNRLRPYLRPLTLRRCLNAVQCRLSYCLSRFRIVHVPHMPTFLSVEPANYCMLRCPACPVGMRQEQREAQQMSMELFAKILSEGAPYCHTLIFYFQGEPLLHKDLPEMIRMAHQQRLYSIVSTNAQLLDRNYAERLVAAGLDKIIVSIDGFTQETYEQYRIGGSLEKAIAALRFLQEAKQRQEANICIELQCLRLSSNEQQWAYTRKHYREWGADRLVLKTAQFYDYAEGHPLMPTDERYSRYHQTKDGHYHLRKRLRNRCYRLWSGAVVTTDGQVLPCCFDKDAAHAFGTLKDNTTLQEIWHSRQADAFRRQLLHHRKEIGICQNCTE